MNERCGNCRFWGTGDERQQKEEYRTCQAIPHRDKGHPSQWDVPAFTSDASDYKSSITTADQFGCVLFQPEPLAFDVPDPEFLRRVKG